MSLKGLHANLSGTFCFYLFFFFIFLCKSRGIYSPVLSKRKKEENETVVFVRLAALLGDGRFLPRSVRFATDIL